MDEDEGLSLRPGPVASLPQRPKLAEPATPAGQTEPLPAFKRGQLSTTSGSVSSIADTPAVSPAPSRVRFRSRQSQVPYRAQLQHSKLHPDGTIATRCLSICQHLGRRFVSLEERLTERDMGTGAAQRWTRLGTTEQGSCRRGRHRRSRPATSPAGSFRGRRRCNVCRAGRSGRSRAVPSSAPAQVRFVLTKLIY